MDRSDRGARSPRVEGASNLASRQEKMILLGKRPHPRTPMQKREPRKAKRAKPPAVPAARDNRLEAALGQVVREFRRNAGLGMSELARLAGLSPGMVSKIEN